MANIPPHDELAEEALLSELLLRPDEVFDRITPILKPDYFYAEARKHIYETIEEMQRAGQKVELSTIAIALRNKNLLGAVGGSQYLIQIVNTVPSAVLYVEQHAITIRDKWRIRQALNLFQAKVAEGYGGNLGGDQEWLEQIEAQLSGLVHDMREQETVALGTVIEAVFKNLQAGPEEAPTAKTGLIDLDKIVSGLYDGDLYILGGRPGLGKSTLAQNIALNVSHPGEAGTLIISPEMPRDQVAMRMLSCESKVEFQKYRLRSFSATDWSQLTAAGAELGRRPIWIHDAASITVLEIRAIARQLSRAIEQGRSDRPARRLGLVIVDYLQLVKGVRVKGDTREQEVASISRDLKAMAKELGVPVLALAALNRSVERRVTKEKKPELADLRESGAIESDADTIMLMHRPDYYDDAERQGECDIIVAKQRNGPTGTATLQFARSVMKFSNFIHGGTSRVDEILGGNNEAFYQDK